MTPSRSSRWFFLFPLVSLVVLPGCTSGCSETPAPPPKSNIVEEPVSTNFTKKVDQLPLSEFTLDDFQIAEKADPFTKAVLSGFRDLQNDPEYYFVIKRESGDESRKTLEVTYAKQYEISMETVDLEGEQSLSLTTLMSPQGGEPRTYQLARLVAREAMPIEDLEELLSTLEQNQRAVVLMEQAEETPSQLSQILGFTEGVSQVSIERASSKETSPSIIFLGPIYRVDLTKSGETWEIKSIEQLKEDQQS